MKRTSAAVASGVVVAAVLAGVLLHRTPAPQLVILPDGNRINIHERASGAELSAQESSVHPASMATFRGAEEDGGLIVMNGHLLINIGVRRWMDFYLSAKGEKSLDEIIHYMESRMLALPSPASTEALAILHSYLAYLDDMDNYDVVTGRKIEANDLDGLNARVAWLEALRRTHFSDEVINAFFAADESLDRYTLQRMALMQSGASVAEQAALEQSLPPQLRAQRQQARVLEELKNISEAAAGNTQTLHELRVERFGDAAAQRLDLLDQRRREWNQRLDAYEDFASSGVSEDALARYRNEHFTAAESARIDAALSVRRAAAAAN